MQDKSGTADLSQREFETLHALSKRILWSNHETRRRLQRLGVNIVPANFYSEIPTIDEIDASFEYKSRWPLNSSMFDLQLMSQWVESLVHQAIDFAPPINKPDAEEGRFYWNNGAYSYSDAMVYYATIRKLRPRAVFEVGSGFSSLAALEALRANDNGGRLICVEPFPKPWLLRDDIELIQEPAQDISADVINDHLQDGDILFIDSTHAVKNGSDCIHLYLRVLPEIRRNVHVHVHDIYLPGPLPKKSLVETQTYWTEQYLLHAYLLDNSLVTVKYAGNYFLKEGGQEALTRLMHGRHPPGGASFWFELRGAERSSRHG